MDFTAVRVRFKSRETSAALALTAAILLVPANLLPVLTTATSGSNRTDTIYSGAMELGHEGFWGLAAIVFVASIAIPVLKLVGLATVLWAARHGGHAHARHYTRIYSVIDFIGRWSMLDVFMAAFLTGLVRFGELATVQARAGMVAFAAAVVMTVLATAAFDPREIWHDPTDESKP
jgi:paraquat-inducible protein A